MTLTFSQSLSHTHFPLHSFSLHLSLSNTYIHFTLHSFPLSHTQKNTQTHKHTVHLLILTPSLPLHSLFLPFTSSLSQSICAYGPAVHYDYGSIFYTQCFFSFWNTLIYFFTVSFERDVVTSGQNEGRKDNTISLFTT
jgi:hypothetical protein